MIGYLDLILRLVVWFLLTSDISWPNMIMGVAIAFLLPRHRTPPEALKDWLQTLWAIMVAIPIAYIEAIEMIFRPHSYEEITREQVKLNRTPGLIFLDIFLITFTPKTIVLKYREEGWYDVHLVRRKQRRDRALDSE